MMSIIPLLDKEIKISPSEWQTWLSNPVTQEYMAALEAERGDWEQMQSQGDLLKGGMATIEEYAKSVGVIYGLDTALTGIGEILQEQWREGMERKKAAEADKNE